MKKFYLILFLLLITLTTISANYDSVVKYIQGVIALRGGTDNTIIGNKGDSLKVTNSAHSKKYRIVLAPGTIALSSSSYTTVYSYSGSGSFFGILNYCNSSNYIARLIIDGETIFTDLNIDDLDNMLSIDQKSIDAIDTLKNGKVFYVFFNEGIPFSSSIQFSLKRSGRSKFQRALIFLTKES